MRAFFSFEFQNIWQNMYNMLQHNVLMNLPIRFYEQKKPYILLPLLEKDTEISLRSRRERSADYGIAMVPSSKTGRAYKKNS